MLAPQLCIVNYEKRKFPNNMITHDLEDLVEGVQKKIIMFENNCDGSEFVTVEAEFGENQPRLTL